MWRAILRVAFAMLVWPNSRSRLIAVLRRVAMTWGEEPVRTWDAVRFAVSGQSVHNWLAAYRDGGLAGLETRSHRPDSSPWQAEPAVEAAVCEMRREHPRWGPRRIAFELGRDGCPGKVPARMTVDRILVRHGLIAAKKRKQGRDNYMRWERPEPMQLWQMDIVGGVFLTTGVELKVVTAVDDIPGSACPPRWCVGRPAGRCVWRLRRR
jgi:transposase